MRILAYLHDQDGASAAEYALILAIVAGAIAAACFTLQASIGAAITHEANCIVAPSSSGC